MLKLILVVCLFGWSCVGGAKFPDGLQQCKYGDSECIVKAIQYVLQERSAGEKSLNLVQIDPLKISKVSIQQGEESPVNIDLQFTQSELIGLRNAHVYKVKGFGKDLTQKHEIHLKGSGSLVGDYKIKGRVLILPIRGSGKSNMTMVNADIGFYFSGTPVEKNGATYMNIEDMKISLKPERMYYEFENLFNGDKTLSDNMNLFLNENWSEIFNEVRDSLTEAFGQIFQSVISHVFSKLPYDKYFIE